MVKIRQATYEDIPRIMRFINDYWKQGHIMGNSRVMFEFQHVEGKTVHYLIAEDENTKYIYGTMGYIPTNHSSHPDVFTMMIRTLEGSGYELLGDDMANYLKSKLKIRYHIGIGLNKRYAKAIAVLEPGTTDEWRQYYRLANRKEYHICDICEKKIAPVCNYKEYSLCRITEKERFVNVLSQFELNKFKPYRDEKYIMHRYWEHPIYEYRYYVFMKDDKVRGVFIGREIKECGEKCFRIVDYYGELDEIRYIGNSIDRLMLAEDYEYVDFCNYGVNESIMKAAGFELVGQDNNIIPHYFEPFEKRNIKIFVYSNALKDLTLFKAFSDQDRPNNI